MKFIVMLLFTFWLSIASAADIGFSTFVTTLATANTRQTLSGTEVQSFDFVIQNPSTNVVSIFIGGSDVTTSGATKGIEVIPGAEIALSDSFYRNRLLTSSKIFLVSTGTAIPVVIGMMEE